MAFESGPEFPLACTLGPDDGRARRARWLALHDRAAPTIRRFDAHLEIRYPPRPGVREELEDLAAAEQRCCAFVAWAVSDDHGQPVLVVTAPPGSPDAVDPIAAMFGFTGPSGTPSA